MPALEEAAGESARVIAFDRPPFGLSERPLNWQGSEEDNPYTSSVRRESASSCFLCQLLNMIAGWRVKLADALEVFKSCCC
jgi:pimeloyl-ACP methyl ester carboxylesterase